MEQSIEQLKAKQDNLVLIRGGIALLGAIGGLVYAIKTKKSGWGKVGYWILGGLITGVPAAMIIYPQVNKIKAEIKDKTL